MYKRQDNEADGSVECRLPIEVSTSTVENMFPDQRFEWDVEAHSGEWRIPRKALKHWVDIVHELLVNAIKHGGSERVSQISIRFHLAQESASLEIRNVLGPSCDYAVVDSRLQRAAADMAQRGAFELANQEGRSGIIKVKKYATIDLKCPTSEVQVVRQANECVATVFLGASLVELGVLG